MKFKLLFPTLLLLFLSTTVFSQNRQRANRPAPQPVSESVENILETLTKKLELSEDQKESSEEILTTYFESLENLREEGARPDRSKMETFSKNRDADFEALLTDSQNKKYLEVKDKLFQQRQRRRPNN